MFIKSVLVQFIYILKFLLKPFTNLIFSLKCFISFRSSPVLYTIKYHIVLKCHWISIWGGGIACAAYHPSYRSTYARVWDNRIFRNPDWPSSTLVWIFESILFWIFKMFLVNFGIWIIQGHMYLFKHIIQYCKYRDITEVGTRPEKKQLKRQHILFYFYTVYGFDIAI